VSVTCPTAHQFYDVRWLRDPKYLRSYAEYFMLGSASKINQRENGNFLTHLSSPKVFIFPAGWSMVLNHFKNSSRSDAKDASRNGTHQLFG
jgi:hypothetical protein